MKIRSYSYEGMKLISYISVPAVSSVILLSECEEISSCGTMAFSSCLSSQGKLCEQPVVLAEQSNTC